MVRRICLVCVKSTNSIRGMRLRDQKKWYQTDQKQWLGQQIHDLKAQTREREGPFLDHRCHAASSVKYRDLILWA